MADDLIRDIGLPKDYRPRSMSTSEISQPMSLKEALNRCIDDLDDLPSERLSVRGRRSSSVHADQVLHAVLYGEVDDVWIDPRPKPEMETDGVEQPKSLRRSVSLGAKHFMSKFSRKSQP